MFLKKLQALLMKDSDRYIFACIEDLVINGLDLSRFTSNDTVPSRQDITHHFAGWFKHIGVPAEDSLKWLTEYSLSMLSPISSSSPSRIRHSTKGNIKYIYKSDLLFICGSEKNKFKAKCDKKCSVFDEMKQRAERESENSYKQEVRPKIQHGSTALESSIKDKYKEQFESSMLVAQQKLKDKIKKKEIVKILNSRGLKTRTGRKWSYAILLRELNSA